MNLLNLEQDPPAHAGRQFDHEVTNERGDHPAVIGHPQRHRHLRALVRVVKNPEEHRDRDRDLEDSDEDFFHSPKRSFQRLTERRISSTVLRGLISQTNKQVAGRSGTSFSRSTSPAKGRLMILRRPNAILHVTAQRARTDRAQPFRVIDEAEVFLDLDVPDVVPVTDLRRVEFIEQRRDFALARNLFVAAPAFDPEPDIFRGGMFDDRLEAFLHVFEVSRRGRLAPRDRLHFPAHVFAGIHLARFGERDERLGHRLDRHLPKMKHDKGRPEPRREIDRLQAFA